MKFINEFFEKYQPDYQKLLDYGFINDNGIYQYSVSFYNDEFISHISVDEKGKIDDKIIEKAFNEEYEGLNIKNFRGDYIAKVKEAYQVELIKIRDACFSKTLFKNPQANRVVDYIEKRYHEHPDFPFDKFDGYAVFRYPENNKWYGLIMGVKKSSFTKNEEDEDVVEAINVKVDEVNIDEALKLNGVYHGYHMNRKNWISILLDDSLDDEEVMKWIDNSRNIIMRKKK